ncbi:hypothetical protein ACWDLG_34535 [Nonomuraea sp. NPDC003727]
MTRPTEENDPEIRDDDGDGFFDQESVPDEQRTADAPPVDPPDDGVTPDRTSTGQGRAPILPAWAMRWSGIRTMLAWWVKDAGYVIGYHAVRLPKYAAKTLAYALVGLFTSIGRLVHWVGAEEGNYALRQAAADRNDPMTWLKLDKQRERQARWRWSVVIAACLLTLALVPILVRSGVLGVLPSWLRYALLAAAVVVFARAGRPADKPITDRVSQGPRYRKLTAELVRHALLRIGIGAINQAVAKDQHALSFPQEIHRHGPGHLAIVDLPWGVEAAAVVAHRGRLASAMRLPLDQVWPEEVSSEHPGRLALWVGYQPASKMTQPLWPLLSGGSVDVFKPFPIFTTPRMETVNASLIFRNWLIGGQPGSGKTFLLRLLVLAASLDPRAELRGYEFKGVGDFTVIEPLCTEYGNGGTDEVIARAAALIRWLYGECQRRAAKISHYHALGKAPENKVTPELASRKGSGLHPLVVFLSEAQELFQHKTLGGEAGDLAEKVIKLGRALGVILLMDTQIPDKDSLPTGITRNINTRVCMSVADHVANDMILGSGMYRAGRRATVFEPVEDAGWGILVGMGKPGACLSFEINGDQAKQIVNHAIDLRVKAGTLPAPETQARPDAPAYDLLADVAEIWPGDQDREWNEVLCARLAELRPSVYGGWQSEQLTSALKPHGVKVTDIGRRIDGKKYTRRGIYLSSLTQAITDRGGTR